ncbi:hypothetical protein BC829DRAFT_455856 [Chytridium lagenaria]|nr:hypothetical protein BC829DRAFT_455856 [Chytridium lagenaria]
MADLEFPSSKEPSLRRVEVGEDGGEMGKVCGKWVWVVREWIWMDLGRVRRRWVEVMATAVSDMVMEVATHRVESWLLTVDGDEITTSSVLVVGVPLSSPLIEVDATVGFGADEPWGGAADGCWRWETVGWGEVVVGVEGFPAYPFDAQWGKGGWGKGARGGGGDAVETDGGGFAAYPDAIGEEMATVEIVEA